MNQHQQVFPLRTEFQSRNLSNQSEPMLSARRDFGLLLAPPNDAVPM